VVGVGALVWLAKAKYFLEQHNVGAGMGREPGTLAVVSPQSGIALSNYLYHVVKDQPLRARGLGYSRLPGSPLFL
jgi:hypothetical protein